MDKASQIVKLITEKNLLDAKKVLKELAVEKLKKRHTEARKKVKLVESYDEKDSDTKFDELQEYNDQLDLGLDKIFENAVKVAPEKFELFSKVHELLKDYIQQGLLDYINGENK